MFQNCDNQNTAFLFPGSLAITQLMVLQFGKTLFKEEKMSYRSVVPGGKKTHN
jgi:hypothetical protein